MCKLVKTIPAEGTNIREKNTQNSALLCRANKNDVFQVVQEQGGWIKIKLQNARVGYVCTYYKGTYNNGGYSSC